MSMEFPEPQLQPKKVVEQTVEEEKKEVAEAELLDALEILAINFEDIEASKVLQRWSEQEYKKVPNNPEAMIEFNLRTARLYLKKGLGEASYDLYCSALEQAQNEGRGDLADKIQKEMDAIMNQPSPEQE